MNSNHREKENAYNAKLDAEFIYFSESDKEEIRRAFNAGREYEASLFKDVIDTIVQQVKLYRGRT